MSAQKSLCRSVALADVATLDDSFSSGATHVREIPKSGCACLSAHLQCVTVIDR